MHGPVSGRWRPLPGAVLEKGIPIFVRLGMLTWNGGDPMSAASWTKKSTPIFQRSDANGLYGPGHASFVRSPDDAETWV